MITSLVWCKICRENHNKPQEVSKLKFDVLVERLYFQGSNKNSNRVLVDVR